MSRSFGILLEIFFITIRQKAALKKETTDEVLNPNVIGAIK